MKELLKQFGTLILGLAIMSFGSAMGLVADLGLGPWDVLNDGTAKFFQGMFNIKLANGADLITFGRANITIGLLVLIIDILCKERLGFGTFINIALCGNIVDLCTGDMIPTFALLPDWRGMPMGEDFGIRFILTVLSLIPCSYGMYIYMSARLGNGPRDSLMVAISRRVTKFPVGMIRLCMECCAFLTGWALGGSVGVGTIITVLLAGPTMQLIFKLHKFDVHQLKPETIPETLSKFRKVFTK